jgi:hypothetical protein
VSSLSWNRGSCGFDQTHDPGLGIRRIILNGTFVWVCLAPLSLLSSFPSLVAAAAICMSTMNTYLT